MYKMPSKLDIKINSKKTKATEEKRALLPPRVIGPPKGLGDRPAATPKSFSKGS
jgi:hypothetical protein